MARIDLSGRIAEDIECITAHLRMHEVVESDERTTAIPRALDALQHNPLIGRPAEGGLRELVIGRDARGHVALYTYDVIVDTIYVLAIRSQRESGYTED